jgi:hypothetical protein
MRPLIIGEEERALVRWMVAYASEPDHWYRPGRTQMPGGDPAHCQTIWSYRCVFSFSVLGGNLVRHLSISVPSAGMPNPVAAFTLAELFGFTGWSGGFDPPKDWQLYVNRDEHCIVLGQTAAANIDDAASFDSHVLHLKPPSARNA